MSKQQILANINKHIFLSDFEEKQFLSELDVKTIPKKKYILKQGDVCKKIYFVESGSLRAFNLNKDGKESTIMFAVKDWWITDMNSFVNQKKAMLSIVSLEQSTILALDFQGLNEIYKRVPKLERFFRILFQNAYIREQQRALHNISFTSEERYRQFVENYPAIVEKVTQKQIASYLGITPEFLSAIKKK